VVIEGGYSEYQACKVRQNDQKEARKPEKWRNGDKKRAKVDEISAKLSYKDQRELDAFPTKIEAMESENAEIEARFCDPDYFSNDAEGYQRDQQRLAELEDELSNAYARWEELETFD